MKKILLSLGLIGILGGVIAITSASSTSCKDVEFDNGVTACVKINDAGTDRRELSTTLDAGSTANLRCDIMTPDSRLRSIPSCNGEFSYDEEKAGRIKLRIRYDNQAPEDREGKPSSSSTRTYPQRVYDFDNQKRIADDLNDDEDDDSDVEELSISDINPEDPDESERIDVNVEARDSNEDIVDSYRGTVRFKVQKRDTSDDERVTASSSLYSLSRTTYAFTSSDDGEHEFSNLVKFNDDRYAYRLVVEDDEHSSIDEAYQVFDFNNDYDDENTNNGDVQELAITDSNPEDPDESERIDVNVEAWDSNEDIVDSYRGTVRFSVQKRDTSDDERVTASSSLYSLSRTTYAFTSSDDGEHEFSNLVKFNDDRYAYRLVVEDDEYSSIDEAYQVFDFGNDYDDEDEDNYDTDSFSVATDDSRPDRNQYVDLTITAKDGSTTDDRYEGDVEFKVYYRQIGYTNRNYTTSLSRYEMKYPYGDNGFGFDSSNDGTVTIRDFIRFKREGYEYKVVVVDEDKPTVQGYRQFTVTSSTSNTTAETDNFYLTTDDTTPTTSQYVDLTVTARKNTTTTNTAYRGTVEFEVYYKASNSSVRTKTTSSTYYDMVDTYEEDGYTFTSSNQGKKTFSNLIKFKKNNYSYKVVVYDKDDEYIEGYKVFNVGSTTSSSSSSSVDGFTTSELRTVESLYDARDDMIQNLKNTYSKLNNSSSRKIKSENLKDAMEEILEDKSNKTYDTFDDFYNDGFLDRYRYTVSIRS